MHAATAAHRGETESIRLDDTEFLTREQAAQILGFSTRTVDRLVASEALKAKKVGRSVRIYRQALTNFMQDPDDVTLPQQKLREKGAPNG